MPSNRPFAPEFPDPETRLRFCTFLYIANTRMALDRGIAYATSLPDGTLTGVLSILPKPSPPWGPDDDARYGYDALAEFAESLSNVEEYEERAHEPLNAIEGPWTYINVLGVDPPYQNQGLGTALMHHAIAEADRDGRPMGLMTDTLRNVRFYERLGFATVLEPAPDAALTLWSMIRPPTGIIV